MRDVGTVGVGMIKFGRFPEKELSELGAQACLLALKDAGMTMKDIETLVSGNLLESNATVGQRSMKEIGQTGLPVPTVANACATATKAIRACDMAVTTVNGCGGTTSGGSTREQGAGPRARRAPPAGRPAPQRSLRAEAGRGPECRSARAIAPPGSAPRAPAPPAPRCRSARTAASS